MTLHTLQDRIKDLDAVIKLLEGAPAEADEAARKEELKQRRRNPDERPHGLYAVRTGCLGAITKIAARKLHILRDSIQFEIALERAIELEQQQNGGRP